MMEPILEINMRTLNRALIKAGFHPKQADFIENEMRNIDDMIFPEILKNEIIEDAWKIIDSFPFGLSKQGRKFWYLILEKLRKKQI